MARVVRVMVAAAWRHGGMAAWGHGGGYSVGGVRCGETTHECEKIQRPMVRATQKVR